MKHLIVLNVQLFYRITRILSNTSFAATVSNNPLVREVERASIRTVYFHTSWQLQHIAQMLEHMAK